MFAAVDMNALILGISVGGSLIGLGAMAMRIRGLKAEAKVPARRMGQIVRNAPYGRRGNALKIDRR